MPVAWGLLCMSPAELSKVASVAAEAWIEMQALRHTLHSIVAYLEPTTFTPEAWEVLAEQARIKAIEDFHESHPGYGDGLIIE